MRITKTMVVLNTDIQTEEKFDFDPEETALKVCEEVLKQEEFPEDAEISLVLTDAEEVHRLNLPPLKRASMRAASTRITIV